MQVKGLHLINGIESSMGREQCVPELLLSDLFDVFFRRARPRMTLHTLVFVCPWFAFCKRWKGKMETGMLGACAIPEPVLMA